MLVFKGIRNRKLVLEETEKGALLKFTPEAAKDFEQYNPPRHPKSEIPFSLTREEFTEVCAIGHPAAWKLQHRSRPDTLGLRYGSERAMLDCWDEGWDAAMDYMRELREKDEALQQLKHMRIANVTDREIQQEAKRLGVAIPESWGIDAEVS